MPDPAADELPEASSPHLLITGDGFQDWVSLNDTIMGGASRAGTRLSPEGLWLEGEVVERGGGFVSCRSSLYRPPLDLSGCQGLRLHIDGEGRTLKLAVACSDGVMGLTEMIPGGLRWVAPMATQSQGTTSVEVLFADLQPVIRAKPVSLPLRFNGSAITRLQVLHSRFDEGGGANSGFRSGPIRLLIRSIEGF